MNFLESLKKLRSKTKKRNFDQTLDLIINLKDFDPRSEILNTFVVIPHLSKKKKICAFLEKESEAIDFVITKNDLNKISENEIKKIAKRYDFFIANAKLMPLIAKKFGKILGMAGKMPNPKMGCVLTQESNQNIMNITNKLVKTIKIRAKEKSIKVAIGKESMQDSELAENASVILNTMIEALPKKELNIKSVLLKFTMSSPIKVGK